MRIEINGQVREFDGPRSVGAIVDDEVADRRGVAVAVDGEVLPRRDWDDSLVTDGARLEIVGAVQGG